MKKTISARLEFLSCREREILEKTIHTLLKYTSPERITLFGSRAKGKASQGSDFDIAVEADRPHPKTEIKLLDEMSSFRGLYTLDLVYTSEIDSSFRELIRKTGKVLYDGRSQNCR